MRKVLYHTKSILTVICLFFTVTGTTANQENGLLLTGSTPGDSLVKQMLQIPAQTPVDFIRWNLLLQKGNQFTLDIHFGESQPNTSGFKNGGEKRSITGSYTVSANNHFREQYHLQPAATGGRMILLVKLTENLFHLLTAKGEFMNGNGGWSYSLNRKNPVAAGDILIHSLVKEDKAVQAVYDGRTPCREIAAEHPEMKVSAACYKLKWRLILNRDPVTFLPTTFTIRKVVDGKAQNISGKWAIQKGSGASAGQLIYIIEPDKPAASISFLVADHGVLFFLDKKNRPYTGNADYSFALNRNL